MIKALCSDVKRFEQNQHYLETASKLRTLIWLAADFWYSPNPKVLEQVMLETSSSKPKLRFGPFLADLGSGELYKRGKRVKIQQQPMQVLSALLERPREVVTREELRKRIWPVDTFVDFEHSLNTAVKKMRLALGDNAGRPRYVETLPRRGYRFLGDVEASEEKILQLSKNAGREVGKVFTVEAEGGLACVVAPLDEKSLEEWQTLKALGDDVGIAMMITESRLLLLEPGNSVRVLSTEGATGWCQARILEGENYGKTAMIPRKSLKLEPSGEVK
jgi:DNA-binding winged helix-turn-helix (wHTH) protein